MTTDLIIDRIIHHRLEYETRNKKKEKKEADVAKAMNLI
ncbi:IstB_IS21 domain-containing protein [Caenorhabditis elegans]|nr:IstB_IS21 domain-containing protein [Caenorhabditis elegans]CDO41115.1 IstB_IS21 domain-containing protein [Caenorhabditis elegans]|eukprot:NP_001293347.1 Phosphocholine CYtidylylTransferase [Caenorhabditis elegans]